MSEAHNATVEVPEAHKMETPVAETNVASEADTATDDSKPADEPKPTEDVEHVVNTDKDEAQPVEEGFLGHKAQGASFPKNLFPTKEFLFFGSAPIEPKSLAQYQKSEKSTETAHHNIAWASCTGKGLLFLGDKKAPTGVINLAHAIEPEVDGPNKFHFTSKGNKHSFKAASSAERDGWVVEIKAKIAEAKELLDSVTESEAYKKTIETLKPTPVAAAVAKDSKPSEEAPKTDDAKDDEAGKDGEAAKEESRDEEPKRRSASRKRASFFGFGGKKDDKEDSKPDEALAADNVADTEEPLAAVSPVPATDDKATEEVKPLESPREKPGPTKRNSFFGNVFSKEKKFVETSKATEEVPESVNDADASATDATAPVIPPVESTTPLAVDVSTLATVPTETVETAPATSEIKKESKEKRKPSLPFAFGKRDKSPAPVEGEEKSGKSAFSKLRATIKGKSAAKTDEKTVEETQG